MRRIIITIVTTSMLLVLGSLAYGQEPSTAQEVDFGVFQPSEKGTFVEVKVSKGLINMAARITEESEPDIAKVIGRLNSIRVNVLELEDEVDEEIRTRIAAIREQLTAARWEQVVKVREDEEDVGIFMKLDNEASIEGLVVTVISGDEAVLVHVDGELRPEELAEVGERFGLPPLERIGEMIH